VYAFEEETLVRFLRRKVRDCDLEKAEVQLEDARKLRSEQERKLEQEDEAVRVQLTRLANGNHLAELAFQALSDRYGKS